VFRPHTYSYVVSTVALVVALSGGAYATGLIGTSQIKNGAVTTAKLHGNAVNSSKVADGSLQAKDISAAQRAAIAPKDQVGGFSNAGGVLYGSGSPTTFTLGTFTPTRSSYANLGASLQFYSSGTFYLGGGVEVADGTGAVVGDLYYYVNGNTAGGYKMATPSGLVNSSGQPVLLNAGTTYTLQVRAADLGHSASVSLSSATATYDLIPAG
jgi:hypothetical protein